MSCVFLLPIAGLVEDEQRHSADRVRNIDNDTVGLLRKKGSKRIPMH